MNSAVAGDFWLNFNIWWKNHLFAAHWKFTNQTSLKIQVWKSSSRMFAISEASYLSTWGNFFIMCCSKVSRDKKKAGKNLTGCFLALSSEVGSINIGKKNPFLSSLCCLQSLFTFQYQLELILNCHIEDVLCWWHLVVYLACFDICFWVDV